MAEAGELVKIFERIRDIPYRIPVSYEEEDNCCSGKSKKLLDALKEKGLIARYAVCTFSWADEALPEEIMKIPHGDMSTHTYVEVYLNDKWVAVDPTWDSGLKNKFRVNRWDGRTSTAIAAKPKKTLSPEESLSIANNTTRETFDADIKINGKFYKAINSWLNKVRKG